ncbi:hypothetical protein [Streptomyces pseudogriseolus]
MLLTVTSAATVALAALVPAVRRQGTTVARHAQPRRKSAHPH